MPTTTTKGSDCPSYLLHLGFRRERHGKGRGGHGCTQAAIGKCSWRCQGSLSIHAPELSGAACAWALQALREAEKAAKMAARKDYYKILGVDPQCEDRDVKKVLQHPGAPMRKPQSLVLGWCGHWFRWYGYGHGKAEAMMIST